MSDRQSSDPIFQQLSSAADLLGLFSMTTEGEVIESLGEFQDQSAELHAPVILHILLDAKGVLDSAPFSRASRGTEPMKRIVRMFILFPCYSLLHFTPLILFISQITTDVICSRHSPFSSPRIPPPHITLPNIPTPPRPTTRSSYL
jgi:hypothetical protein